MVTSSAPGPRRQRRQRLVLDIAFDDAAGFSTHYLAALSGGGVRIDTSMAVGQQFRLRLSVPGFADLAIHAVVQWSLPARHPDGPAAGLAFLDPPRDAAAWLCEVLDASARSCQTVAGPATRVLLLELQPFLREVYGREVRNWAELHGEDRLELVVLDDPAAWLDQAGSCAAAVGILDLDDVPAGGIPLYQRVRARAISAELPLIMLGSPANLAALSGLCDERLHCLSKPLRFGALMAAVGALARRCTSS